MEIARIEHQAVDGLVVHRIYTTDDLLLLEYRLTPTDAMGVARSAMEKAAEAVTQPIPPPINGSPHGRHCKIED